MFPYIYIVICTHTFIYIYIYLFVYPRALFLLLEGDRATPSRLLVAAGPCAARSRDRCETDSVLLARATWCNMNLHRYFLCYSIQYSRVHVYSFTSSLDEAEYLGSLCLFASFEFFIGLLCLVLHFFCRVLIFSAAAYSHVTVTSSIVVCINADISASRVLSCKKG